MEVQETVRKMSGPLLAWYDRNARVLPWRQQPTPYRVWVSEIMLQQTRVEAVISYFNRFLGALPNIMALAACPEDQLLKLWEGLGYYNRVRNLQKAAIAVVDRYNGELPANYDELLTLPGIGEYTAGAIASIAYGIPVPAADGNVFRVLSRMMCCGLDIAEQKARREFRQVALDIIPQDRPGDFNQAMMELGATVCIPNGAPLCHRCPVAELCRACARGTQLDYPVKSPKKPRKIEERTVFILTKGETVCLLKRPEKGLLAGLWEFYNIEGVVEEEQLGAALGELGISQYIVRRVLRHKHIFTHVEWHMTGYFIEVSRQTELGTWVSRRRLAEEYALPNAFEPFKKAVLQQDDMEQLMFEP